ncbi:MAG: integrase core domain-containing protein [Planctomycetaceae bacterium]
MDQTVSLIKDAKELKLPIGLAQHDRDTKFAKKFRKTLRENDVKPAPNRCRSPNANVYMERFVQSNEKECPYRLAIFGSTHLDHLCQEYFENYHQERPHQELANEILVKPKSEQSDEANAIVCLKDIRCKLRLLRAAKRLLAKSSLALSWPIVAAWRFIVAPVCAALIALSISCIP